MSDSKGSRSVVVGDQGSADGESEVVVVPDGGGQGQETLRDPGADPGDGAAAVAFEVELAFQGVVDRLDDLAQRLKQPLTRPPGFAGAGGSEQGDAGVGEFGLEQLAVVVLVPDHGLPGPSGQAGGVGEDVGQGVSLVGFGAGERPADREAVQGGDQVQPQPPEVAGVGGAVAVFGPPGQVGTLRGLAGAAALHRGRVDHPDGV